ncbi:MAG: acyl--CoA ligase [Butyrivibrio sp.]|nr:acyl--CoA ligase [Butyrivibrio sp.]
MVELIKMMESYGDAPAFKNLDGESSYEVTYRQYLHKIKACAYNLQNTFGDLTGKHIGIMADSNYEYTILLGAILFSRGVLIPVNFLETPENIQAAIYRSDLDGFIVEEKYKDKAVGDFKIADKAEMLKEGNGSLELKDFTDDEKNNLALIVFTSGTTSLSKGVMLSVGNLLGFTVEGHNDDYSEDKKASSGSRIYNIFPFYHIAGINGWLYRIEQKATTYLSADSKNVLSDLEGEQIDVGLVTPGILKLWQTCIKKGNISRLGGLKLALTGGAKPEVGVIQTFLDNGIGFGQYYGMTETCGNITCNFDVINHLESVGRPVDGCEVSFIDGEICVRYYGVMLGYYKDPEGTAEVLEDGLLHTGDLGYLADDGFLYITGRKKNLIILSSGENVSPEELEKKLYENPKVKECLVYEQDDRIHAGVYCDAADQEEIKQFVTELNKELPIYKKIYKVDFRDQEFEKTQLGKIKR